MAKKAKRTLTHAEAVRFGRMGGSPILKAWVTHRPNLGYKVTKGKK